MKEIVIRNYAELLAFAEAVIDEIAALAAKTKAERAAEIKRLRALINRAAWLDVPGRPEKVAEDEAMKLLGKAQKELSRL